MRILNQSKLPLPRELWNGLASVMGLGATLPQAVDDELGMYGRRKYLQVRVQMERDQADQHGKVTVGSYTFGRIELFPCPKCTPAFLTHVFLHELCHAWLHQFHEALYEQEDTCGLCNRFADESFKVLGGKSPRLMNCQACSLPEQGVAARMPRLRAHLDQTLLNASTAKLASLIGGSLNT